MNDTQIRKERPETHDDVNADPQKWEDAIQNLIRIIERNEQKLGYFQNRVKQAQFMDRPNSRKVRTAGAQVGVHSTHLEGLRSELRQLERLQGGGIRLRQASKNELRRIWGWINRPGIRNLLYATQVSFETFLGDAQGWMENAALHALAIEIRTTRLLIGFLLLQCEGDTVTLKFVIIRPDYRGRGYGTDALLEVVHYAFEHLEAAHITLHVSADNGPALICFENAGFRYLSYTDTAEQMYTMGIERSEWSGEMPIDDPPEIPRLSTPLKVFFEPEE